MNVAQSLTLKGLGPTGTTFIDFDPVTGLLKDRNNRAFQSAPTVAVSLFATMVDSFIWSPTEGIWQVDAVAESHTVVGGSGAQVQVVVCPGSVAIASGTAQLTAALDLTVTAPACRFGTLIASPTRIMRGDSVGVDVNGTLTGLVGQLTVTFRRIG